MCGDEPPHPCTAHFPKLSLTTLTQLPKLTCRVVHPLPPHEWDNFSVPLFAVAGLTTSENVHTDNWGSCRQRGDAWPCARVVGVMPSGVSGWC